MVDAGIGRLLISSLHQGIADVAPSRLEFYEEWLSPTGMRDGRIGLAPLGAVLSFLHREEAPANEAIVERAGRYAADWTFQEISGFRRWCVLQLPIKLRVRAALALCRRLILATVRESTITTRALSSGAEMDITSALFKQLRDPATLPMRAFCAAAVARLLAHCAVDAGVAIHQSAGASWSLAIQINGSREPGGVDAA